MQIQIDRTMSLFQSEDGNFKVSIFFQEEFAEQFLALKRKAKETGQKMCLSLTDIKAEVERPESAIIKNIEDSMDEIKEWINGIYKKEEAPDHAS